MNKLIVKVMVFVAIFASFNLNIVEASSAPSCTLSGGTIYNLSREVMRADIGYWNDSISTNIPAGKYDIVIQTWDDHSGHGGQNQTDENIRIDFKDSSNKTLKTVKTTDIPENHDVRNSYFYSVDFDTTVDNINYYHAHRGDGTGPQSLAPVCIQFKPKSTPEPTELSAVCNVSSTRIYEGESVRYTSTVSGGDSPYTYNWSGVANGNSSYDDVTINTAGSYTASVTVTSSDLQTKTVSCPTVVVEDRPKTDLDVECRVSDTRIEEGENVTYEAIVSGGNSPFDYDWDGDANGSSRTVTERYDDEGYYYASIRVTDEDGRTAYDSCPTVRVEEEETDDLEVQCEISDRTIDVGDRVTISVDIDGGAGGYDIEWSRDTDDIDDFDDNDRSQRIRIDEEGTYDLKVTVEDRDGNRDSDTCTLRVDDDEDRDINVISNVDDNQLAGLSSIYLNQVPYTGAEDNLKIVGIISLILVWSSAVGYYLLKDRRKKKISNRVQAFKEANKQMNA